MARGKASLFVGSTDTVEKKQVPINLETDPTGAAVAWGFTDEDDKTPPASWTNGTWHGDGFANETVIALTPTLGATGSTAAVTFTVADATKRAWVKFTNGSDTVVRPAGYLNIYA